MLVVASFLSSAYGHGVSRISWPSELQRPALDVYLLPVDTVRRTDVPPCRPLSSERVPRKCSAVWTIPF